MIARKHTGAMPDARALRFANRVDDIPTIERKMNSGCRQKLSYDDILPPARSIPWDITVKHRDWKYLIASWSEKDPSPERDAFIAECRAELAKEESFKQGDNHV